MHHHNIVVLRGTVSSAPRHRELPSGSTLVQLELTTRCDEGTLTVPVSWFDPSAVPDADDDVVIVGHVRRRFFRAGGVTQSRTEVVAARVIRASRRRDTTRALAPVLDALAELAG